MCSPNTAAFRMRELFVKNNIYDFINDSQKTVVVVDCENSDPYKLCAALRNLDYEVMQKISKIILFDDVHTVNAWKILEYSVKIPVEHIMTERVKQNKSLVDIQLTARACQSIIKTKLIPSLLFQAIPTTGGLFLPLSDARFLVMIEREKMRAGYESRACRFRNILLLS